MTGRLRVACLWLLAAGWLAGAAGAWPMWSMFGREGLLAEGTALVIVFAWMTAAAAVVAWRGRHGPLAAAVAFIWAGLAGGVGALLTACAACLAAPLPAMPVMIWAGVFDSAMLLAAGFWLARQLANEAFGPVRPHRRSSPKPSAPSDSGEGDQAAAPADK